AFASKSLNHAQAKYPAHRLEFFAMKLAICNKFSHWLRGHRFTMWPDNNPLKYILTKPRLDACEQRWVAQLPPFDFDIQYIPGTKNVVADALSREPFVQSKILHRLTRAPYSTLLKQVANFQKDDVPNFFRLSAALPELRDVNAEILRQWGKLNTRLGIMYRVSKHPVTKQKTYQYVVPESLRMAVLKGIHDDAGHQGQQRSLGFARQRFYWDTMEKDVKDYVHNCKRC
ncbi:hypothetical protein C0J50_20439, partial [Silurus asotus]